MRFEFGVVCMFVFVNKGERGNGENEKRRERETKDGLEITLACNLSPL